MEMRFCLVVRYPVGVAAGNIVCSVLWSHNMRGVG